MQGERTAGETAGGTGPTGPIGVVGLGTVGLATAIHLAEGGHRVRAIDADRAVVADLRDAGPAQHGASVARAWHAVRERIEVGADLDRLDASSIVFVAVGVPPDPRSGALDTGALDTGGLASLIDRLARLLPSGAVVAVRSTVPIGTIDALNARVARLRPLGRVTVVANPEFLSEGRALDDMRSPSRVVLGGPERAVGRLAALYRDPAGACPILRTDARSAEAIKLVSNAMLAARVAFANEVADLVEATGGNVDAVLHGVGLDPRIGPAHLAPGPGFGGSCLPKDAAALAAQAAAHDRPMRLVEAALAANAARLDRIVARIDALLDGAVEARRIALLGLAFKAGTHDARDSPALALARRLAASGAEVRACDPAIDRLRSVRASLATPPEAREPTIVASVADAVAGSGLTVIATGWPVFRAIDFASLAPLARTPILLDLRRLLDPGDVALKGWTVHRIGDPPGAPDDAGR